MEIEGRGFGLGRDEFDAAFAPLARQHGMRWRVGFTDRPNAWPSWSRSRGIA